MNQNESNSKKSKAPQTHVYPDAELSDKQLEALNRVLGPAANEQDIAIEKESDIIPDIIPDNKNLKADTTKATKKTKEKKKIPITEIEKDRTVVKTVFLVVFLVLFVAAAAFAGWYYWWTTHATFDHTLHPVVILEGQNVLPEDFMYPGEDMENVTAVFQDPDFDPFVGLQYVQLTLSLGLRSLDTAAALYVLTPIDSVEHEYAEEGATLRAVDMLQNPEVAANVPFVVSFTETPQPLDKYEVGEHTLNLELNEIPFSVTLIIVDTTPPIALPVPVTTRIGVDVAADQFVTDVFDASGINSITFEHEPDFFAQSEEEQIVRIVIDDNNGNSETFSSSLFIELNQMPPVIEGAPDVIESKIDTDVDYLTDVIAHDDFDRKINVFVNDDAVDTSTLGTYTAVIWAEDYSGNKSEHDVTVHIISVDRDEVFEQIDRVLAEITNARMSQKDKAVAIHNWVRSRMTRSTTASDSESVLEVAYQALSTRRGNSFAYSALASVMLTRAEVPNMLINRIESASAAHRWVLINPDEKGWHHFDPFPTGMVLGNQTAMFTDTEAKEIARRTKQNFNVDDYYTFNTENYPEIVKE